MKIKQKSLSILVSLVILLSPLSFAATTAYADPILPTTPVLPSSPTLPSDPTQPIAPTIPTLPLSPTTTSPDTTSQQTAPTDSQHPRHWSDWSPRTRSNSETSDLKVDAPTSTDTIPVDSVQCLTGCTQVSLDSLNGTTGDGSTNNSTADAANTNNTTVNNGASISNIGVSNSNTGINHSDENTGDGGVFSGSADTTLTAVNVANNVNVGYKVFNVVDDQTGDIVIDYNTINPTSLAGIGTSSSNNQTGADSINNATTTADGSTTLILNNDGTLSNDYVLNANTGYNTADENTGDGSITTGDANVDFNLINFLNNNFTGGTGDLLLGVVNIFGTLTGDIVLQGLNGGTGLSSGSVSAQNNTTGANSDNNASSSSSNDASLTLNNNANILNNVNLNATTGNNTAGENTGGGSITTGNTNANLKTANIANTNTVGDGGTIWMVLVNNLGKWTGQLFSGNSSTGSFSPFLTFNINPDGSISADNSNTGTGSTNKANSNVNNTSNTEINNNANLTNNVVINANTGGNSASENTGNGTISTGNVNAAVNILNILNNNFIGTRFAVTIVNIFGSFLGSITDHKSNTGTTQSISGDSMATNQGVVSHTSTKKSGSLSNSGSSSSDSSNKGSSIVLSASNVNQSLPTARFNADRGLFDGFRLEYILIPLLLAAGLTIFRRVLIRR